MCKDTIIGETCGIVIEKSNSVIFDADEEDEDSDLEHNKVLWPFLCTLLDNVAAESLLHGFVKSLLLTKPD